MPYITPRLVNTCSACILGRGTLYAVNMTEKYMREAKKKYGNYYVVKLDIKKYFYNIDKDNLYQIMASFIKDKILLWLTKIFIYDNDSDKGIPIGNYTSQYYANIYLSLLDKYVKENLRIKYYVRYMDDIVILVKNKQESKILLNKINLFLHDRLKLELNKKSRYYPNSLGVNFCGYIIYETHRLIRKSSKKKIKRKIRLWLKLKKNGTLNVNKVIISFNSWSSHVSHANSYNFRMLIDKEMINLMKKSLNIFSFH